MIRPGASTHTYQRGAHSSPTIPFPLSSASSHIMAAVPSTSTSHTNFASIFDAALEKYNRNAKQDLVKHPLLPRLQSCHSPEAILTALREQTPEFNQSQNSDDALIKWVAPTVNVLNSFSATLGGVAGLVNFTYFLTILFNLVISFQAFPPANIIFTGIGVFLLVCVRHGYLARLILIPLTLRQLKMPALAETSSSTSSTASKDFSNDLSFTLALHRLRL